MPGFEEDATDSLNLFGETGHGSSTNEKQLRLPVPASSWMTALITVQLHSHTANAVTRLFPLVPVSGD